MHRRLLLGLALLAYYSAHAQPISEQKQVVAFLFGTVHPLKPDRSHFTDAAGQPIAAEAALGTAFFVLYPDARGGPDFAFSYLATAKHVLKDVDGTFLSTVRLRLNLLKSEGKQGIDFINAIPVTDHENKLLWIHNLEDDAVDVALFPLLPDSKRFSYNALPVSMFVDDQTLKSEGVAEGDPLYFIGLMSQYYGASRNHPVVRSGTLALMTEEKIDTPTGPQNAFIAELASWPGNSGSPVFLNLGGLRGSVLTVGEKLRFLGILAGTYQNRWKAQTVEAGTIVGGSGEPTGISFIIPAKQIRLILESSTAQALRDAEIKRRGLGR